MIFKDLPEVPKLPATLAGDLFGDLVALLGSLGDLSADIAKDGKLDSPPPVLRRTLATLYGVASLETTINLLRELIGPKNRSVRLAIILYARANGIQISERHIDVIRDTVLVADPDLGPALVSAAEVVASRYDPLEIDEFLRVLARVSDPLSEESP